MKAVIENEKATVINYGDAFQQTKNNEHIYFLVEYPVIALVHINGSNWYSQYSSLSEARNDLTKAIEKRKLIHFSQSEFTLKLEKK